MKLLHGLSIFTLIVAGSTATYVWGGLTQQTGAPPYGEAQDQTPELSSLSGWTQSWQRPDGPPKVALQVGHWKNNQFPKELHKLRGNSGASAAGITEVEVNLKIAQETQLLLQPHGITVEILPATVPPNYWADVFLAIHADGSTSTATSGYKFARPWRDLTGNADQLVTFLDQAYANTIDLAFDPNITRNMRGYYAFAWWRYEHSIHPMTTAAIAETGFLTNHYDRSIIVDQPQLVARGLSQGILGYLNSQQLIQLDV